MKKLFLICAVLAAAGVSLNAQTFQTVAYNDGKISAWIQQAENNVRPGQYGNRNAGSGELVIENIFSGELAVKYCFKSAALDYNGNLINEKITYRDVTLRAGGKRTETGVESRGGGGYFVASFSITSVRVRSISALPSILHPDSARNTRGGVNSSAGKNTAEVPAWARGTWYISEARTGGKFAEITSSQFVGVSALDCTKAEGDFVWFGGSDILITRSQSPNQIFLALRAKSGNTFTTLYR